MPPAPVVKIFTKETTEDDNLIRSFMNKCLEADRDKRPYLDESIEGAYQGLIFEYDAQTLRDMLPEKRNANNKIIRTEGKDRHRLQSFFESIATEIGCNLILVNSEALYCKVHKTPEFRQMLQETIDSIEPSDIPTIGILIVCNANNVAFKLNQERNSAPPPFGHAEKSRNPFFIGFNGMIHTVKEDIFLCTEDYVDFPTRVCKTEKIAQNNTNAQSFNNRNWDRMSEIFARNNAHSSERLKCCKAMAKEFQNHFVKALKSDRKCIKITREKLIERLRNLLTKQGSLTVEDSTIRKYETNAKPYDGVLCDSVNNSDPCDINSYIRSHNIVPEETEIRAREYLSQLEPQNVKLGELMFLLRGKKARNFIAKWSALTPAEKAAFILLEQIPGVGEPPQNALTTILENKLVDIETKKEIVNLLIRSGANVLNSDNSIGKKMLTKNIWTERYRNNKLIQSVLINSGYNLSTNRQIEELRTDEDAGKKLNEIVGNALLFVNEAKARLSTLGVNPRIKAERKTNINTLIERVGTRYGVNFNMAVKNAPGYIKDRDFAANLALLNALHTRIRISAAEKTLVEWLAEAINTIVDTGSQQRFNIAPGNVIPVPPPVAAEGGKRNRTKKNHRAKRQTRRR